MTSWSFVCKLLCADKLHRLCLDAGDGDNAYHVLSSATTRKIVHGSSEALQHGAVSLCATQALDQLIADVRCIQIGEDKHVRFAGNWGIRCFGSAQFRNDSRIELKFAIGNDVGIVLADVFDRLHDLGGIIVHGATMRGMREQRDTRVIADQAL